MNTKLRLEQNRAWLSLATVIVLLFFVATPAMAHANLVRSVPAANSAQPVPPKIARLWFSENVEPSFSSIRVLDKLGKSVDKGDSHRMSDDPAGMEVSLSDLPEGLYTVAWNATSAVDGHVTSGSFPFTVGAVSLSESSPREIISLVDAALASEAPPPLYQVIVRWLNILLLALLVGSFFFPLFTLLPALRFMQNPRSLLRAYADYATGRDEPKPSPEDATALQAWSRRWVRFSQILFGLFALATVATLFGQSLTVSNSFDAVGRVLISTRLGTVWLVRVALLIALGFVMFRARWRWAASARSNPALVIAALLGFLLLITQSLNSHNAAVNDPPMAPFIADLIHLFGVAIWVGGLVQLLVTLPAFIRALPSPRQTLVLSSLITTFSLVAFITVGVIIVSGTYTLVIQVGSLEAFFGTLYGTTLFVKFLLILPLLALGALNLIVTRPASARNLSAHISRFLLRFDLAVGLEIILAAGVLLAVGMLTSIAPARSVYNPVPPLWMGSHRAEDLQVTLGIAPGLAGTNDFDVKVQNLNGQPVADALVVRLLGKMREMEMGVEEVATTNQGGGHYTQRGDLMSMVGTWDIKVLVRRRGADDVLTLFSLPALGQRPLQANAPLIVSSPEAQVGLGLALFGLAFGTTSVLLLKRRTMRWLSLAGAILVSLMGAFAVYQVSANPPAASAFVVPAVPEFARLTRSPIPPAPNQIAAGQQIYAQNCDTCHGTAGKGDGPSAANLTPKPADLTVHVPMHTDGELYWWITHGIETTAMPAWDTRLTDLQRWQVVQFIRTFGAKATPVPPVGNAPSGK